MFLINEVMKKSHATLVYVHQEAVTDYIIIISPGNHEKADMSVIILVFDYARKGSQKLLIRKVDTDILVLLSLSGSSRDQPSIRISKIKSASDVSLIHKMRFGVGIGRKRQKMHGRFGECIRRSQSHSSTDTIGAENDGCHA